MTGRGRALDLALALIESLLALGGAMLLTLLLLPLVLPGFRDVEFRVAAMPGDPAAIEALRAAIDAEGLAREVGVDRYPGGDARLTLRGVQRVAEAEARVATLLEERGLVAGAPETRIALHWDESGHPEWLTASLALQTLVFLVLGLGLARWRVPPTPVSRPVARLPAAVGLGLIGGVAAVLLATLTAVGLEAAGVPVEEQEWVREVLRRPEALVRLAPWMLVLGPLAEEAFFRGYVLRFVGRRGGFAAGLLFSSLLFAAIHLNLSGFLVYLVIGIVLGFCYEVSGRLVTPVVAHVLNNAVVTLAGVYAETPGG